MSISILRTILVPASMAAALAVSACSTGPSRSTVRETEHVYRGTDEVCRQRTVTEQGRDRDNDRTRVSKTETVCRDR